MIIYNREWLDNLQLHQQVETEQHAGSITAIEVNSIKAKYRVGFYMPGIFGRIGLGLLTLVISIFTSGLIALITAGIFRVNAEFVLPLVVGIAHYIALEQLVERENYYRSGVDDVLIWISAASISVSFIWAMSHFNKFDYPIHYIATSIFLFLLGLYFVLRFADVLMAAATSLCLLSTFFFVWKSAGAFGVATLPFMMMIAAGCICITTKRLIVHPISKYYTACLQTARLTGLVVLYLAGNYFIVQKLGSQINHLPDNAPIPFGFIFWGWTTILPLAYLLYGIIKKDAMPLRLGLILIAVAIGTFRYYYHLLPAEVALTLGGTLILGLVYTVVKYLKVPKRGFTYAETSEANSFNELNLEGLLISQTMPATHTGPAKPESRFGGGNFGGGGSSGDF